MDRVFLDANVLFSAAYSVDNGLLRLGRRRSARLLTSAYAEEEAMRNLERSEQRERLVDLMARVERVPDAAQPLAPAAEATLPADDRPILRAALLAGATHLLSGDRRAFGPHFGQRLGGVLVLRPADYLALRRRR